MLEIGKLIVFTKDDGPKRVKMKALKDLTVDDFSGSLGEVILRADMVVYMDGKDAIVLKDRYGIADSGGNLKKISFAKKCMNAINLYRR